MTNRAVGHGSRFLHANEPPEAGPVPVATAGKHLRPRLPRPASLKSRAACPPAGRAGASESPSPIAGGRTLVLRRRAKDHSRTADTLVQPATTLRQRFSNHPRPAPGTSRVSDPERACEQRVLVALETQGLLYPAAPGYVADAMRTKARCSPLVAGGHAPDHLLARLRRTTARRGWGSVPATLPWGAERTASRREKALGSAFWTGPAGAAPSLGERAARRLRARVPILRARG